MAITSTDTKLRFLHGEFKNLPTTVTNGTVYITTDAGNQNMFVDLNDTRIRLNKFMIVSAIPDSVPAPVEGVVYYSSTQNILAYHKGTEWIQINSQRNFSSYLKTWTNSSANLADGSGVTLYSTIASDGSTNDKNNGLPDNQRHAAWQIKSGNANTVKVQRDNDATLVDADRGTLTAPVVQITAANTDTTVAYSAAKGTGNSATISATPTTKGWNASGAEVNTTGTAATVANLTLTGGTVGVTAAGNVISLDTRLLSLTPVFSADGKFSVEAAYRTSATSASTTFNTVTPTVKIGANNSQLEYKFDDKGVMNISGVYTAGQVDAALGELEDQIASKVQAAQAMTYKGTLSSVKNKLPTSNVSLGDTYYVDSDMSQLTAAGQTFSNLKKGDMFIAYGSEGDDGYISGAITWHYIPAGNDALPDYKVVLADNSFKVTKTYALENGGDPQTLGIINAGSQLTGTINTSTKTLTIAHGAIAAATGFDATTRAKTAAASSITGGSTSGYTLNAVTGITFADNGHVTGYTITPYTIKFGFDLDETKFTTSVVAGTDDAPTKATVNYKLTDLSGNTVERAFMVTTSSKSSAEVTVSTIDNKPTVNIDLVWGKF